jgi:hypothetical protein
MFENKLNKIIREGLVTTDAACYLIKNPEEYLTLIKTKPTLALNFANYFNTEQVNTLVANAHHNNNKILSKIAAIPGDFSASYGESSSYNDEQADKAIIEACKLTDAPGRNFTTKEQIMRQHITISEKNVPPWGKCLKVTFGCDECFPSIIARFSNKSTSEPDKDKAYTVFISDEETSYREWERSDPSSAFFPSFYRVFNLLKAFAEMSVTSISILNILLEKINRNNPSAEPNFDAGYFSREVPNIFKSTLYDYQLENLRLLLAKSDPITSLQQLLKHDGGEQPIFSQLIEKLSGENRFLVAKILETVADKLAAIGEGHAKRAIVASMPVPDLQVIADYNTQLAWKFINAAGKDMPKMHKDFYQRVDHIGPSAPPAIPVESQGSSSSGNSAQTQNVETDEQAAEKDNNAAMVAGTEENTTQRISVFLYILSGAANLGREVLRGLLHPLLESSEAEEAEQETQDDEPKEPPPVYQPPATNPAASAPEVENETDTPQTSAATTAPSYRAHQPTGTAVNNPNYVNVYPNLANDARSTASAAAEKTQTDSTESEKDISANASKKKGKKKVAVPA